MRLRPAAVLGTALGLLATTVLSGPAAAQEPTPAAVASAVQELLVAENVLLLADDHPQAALADDLPELTGDAVAKVNARRTIMRDRAYARELAGTVFSSTTTEVSVTTVTSIGSTRVADVVERTEYPIAGTSTAYGYTARHRVLLAKVGLRWLISDIAPLDAVSDFSATRIGYVRNTPVAQRRAVIHERVTALRAGIASNRERLVSDSAAKLAGRPVGIPSDAAGTARPDGLAQPSSLARPAGRPYVTSTTDGAAAPAGGGPGSGPPYNYQAMVDWVLKYAKDEPVSYTRDENDCTTFISWGLYQGGWAEEGSESILAVLANHDDDDVWYWRCNDCTPRHSYTWGGAINWQRFAYSESGRVTALRYLTELLLADVMQMEIDGYGSDTGPDHTMMVTGFDGSGNQLLSYHSQDTRNKLIWDITAVHDGPYWALRT